MPGALKPVVPATGESWYSPEEWSVLRLSSKSHWDIPVRLPGGGVLHVLASHPTPPAFDGPEMRNRLRNSDEIRFWADYLDGADYIRDDAGRAGGLAEDRIFVLLGDLNADPEGTVRSIYEHFDLEWDEEAMPRRIREFGEAEARSSRGAADRRITA